VVICTILVICCELSESIGKTDQCTYECPKGKTKIPNPDHKPVSNGCGSYGISLVTDEKFTPCCDVHDICYDTCGNSREKCDSAFKKCLQETCKSSTNPSQCKQTADTVIMGTSMFGCGAYQESQKKACICVQKKGEQKGEL